jgi:hypothetical protein
MAGKSPAKPGPGAQAMTGAAIVQGLAIAAFLSGRKR